MVRRVVQLLLEHQWRLGCQASLERRADLVYLQSHWHPSRPSHQMGPWLLMIQWHLYHQDYLLVLSVLGLLGFLLLVLAFLCHPVVREVLQQDQMIPCHPEDP